MEASSSEKKDNDAEDGASHRSAEPSQSSSNTPTSSRGQSPPENSGPDHSAPLPVSPDRADQQGQDTPKTDQDGVFKSPMSIAPVRLGLKKKTGTVAPAFTESSTESPESTLSDSKSTEEKQEKKQDAGTGKSSKSHSQVISPAEQLKQNQTPIPYKEPNWGTLCSKDYSFLVIRNGIEVDTIDLKTKSFHVIGRLPSCDVTMEHPSLSRYHAVVQYCGVENQRHDVGWYLYDLDSTHGTWINKNKVKPRIYIRLRVGHVVKFGGSTRLNILQGPDEDQEAESDLSVTEMKEQRQKQKLEAEVLRQAELADTERDELRNINSQPQGCSWGMDDSDPEEISSENPFALNPEPQHEELYIEDPKKALRGFFEREGLDLPEYDVIEEMRGHYKCRVELPIDGPSGEPIKAEATVSGKKKDAVAACALEACRILDRHGELRKSTHESRAKKKKNWEENDFYDSDEDTFLDRTGDIEKKRKMRMQRIRKGKEMAETYESLTSKLSDVNEEITEIEKKLQQAKEQAASFDEDGLDAFDAYMMALKSGVLDTKTKTKLKRQLLDLKQEKQKLERMASVAKPALPGLQKCSAPASKGGVMFGKMKGPLKLLAKTNKSLPSKISSSAVSSNNSSLVEEEDDDDEEEIDNQPIKTQHSKTLSHQNMPEISEAESDTSVPVTTRISAEGSVSTEESNAACDRVPSLDSPADKHKQGETTVKSPCDSSDHNTCLPSTEDAALSEVSSTSPGDHQVAGHNVSSDVSPVNTTVIPQMAPPSPMAPPSTMPLKKRKSHDIHKDSKKSRPGLSNTEGYKDLQDDPDYATWVPPTDQSGDGRTHLNAKYGY